MLPVIKTLKSISEKKTVCAFAGTCCGLQTEQADASVAESGKKKKALPVTHQNGNSRNQPVPPKQSQTYLDEGLYEGPPSSVEVSMMKIPRPKHCSRNSDLFQSNNGGTIEGEAPFHSDNYLQAATKNKRRTSRLSSAHNQPVLNGSAPPVTGAPQAGINLREMYTNRAFKD